jgi:hypothetical protein
MARNNNTPVVPQAMAALEQLKYEVANELGIQVPADGYYGNMTSRDTGAIGGHMVRRLVQLAEQSMGQAGGMNMTAQTQQARPFQ